MEVWVAPEDCHSSRYGHRKEVDYEDIYTEGITKITMWIFSIQEVSASVKLLGTKTWRGMRCTLRGVLKSRKESPLYSVNSVYNGIMVKGTSGTCMFYGSGAGKLPTWKRHSGRH